MVTRDKNTAPRQLLYSDNVQDMCIIKPINCKNYYR